ncbi:transposable element Tcb2 transposase [Trichonephila clavipes]|nr:transposable element Tcb2 transposase [Trichonephila clavipes]
MSSRHHVDDSMRGRIIGKIEEGRKITDVAREFDIAHSVVSRLKRNRRTTAQQVANQFLAASGKQISRKTVARRLRGGGLYARRPVVCVPLTRQHRTARLQWCHEHHNWNEQDWTPLDYFLVGLGLYVDDGHYISPVGISSEIPSFHENTTGSNTFDSSNYSNYDLKVEFTERDKAPIATKALGLIPVGPCLTASVEEIVSWVFAVG